MTDIATVWIDSKGDWVLDGAQLQSGNDLATAVLISLFTDRVALSDDVIPDGTQDPRGWWADDPSNPIGSRLWLLDRSKQTQAVLQEAQGYAEEALAWLIADQVVSRFDIYTEWTRPGMLGISVTAHKPDGSLLPLRFAWAWK